MPAKGRLVTTLTFADVDVIRAWSLEHVQEMQLLSQHSRQLREVTRALHTWLASDPLSRRYIRHLPEPNTQPWHAIGEQRYAAMLALAAGQGWDRRLRLDASCVHLRTQQPTAPPTPPPPTLPTPPEPKSSTVS